MAIRERFYLTVIAVLSVLLFFYWQCRPGCKCPEVKERIVEIHDTTEAKKPKPVYIKVPGKTDTLVDFKSDTLYLPQEGEIDTAKIVREALKMLPEYATLKYYLDTAFIKDSIVSGTIVTADSVQFNTLFSHQVFTDLKVKQKVIVERKRQFFIGIATGINNKENPLGAFGAGGQYIDLKGRAYGFDYILLPAGQKLYYFSFKKKI
jgi:hypothetical protein